MERTSPRPRRESRRAWIFAHQNHPYIDGNKRIGHGAMEAMLMMNGFELVASVDDAEIENLAVAAGDRTRVELLRGVGSRIQALSSPG